MIRLERTTVDTPDLTTYEDVGVTIAGGFENTVEEWLNFFFGFLVLLSFPPDMIIEGMKEYVSRGEDAMSFEDRCSEWIAAQYSMGDQPKK